MSVTKMMTEFIAIPPTESGREDDLTLLLNPSVPSTCPSSPLHQNSPPAVYIYLVVSNLP
jgi:hypothetical protein